MRVDASATVTHVWAPVGAHGRQPAAVVVLEVRRHLSVLVVPNPKFCFVLFF